MTWKKHSARAAKKGEPFTQVHYDLAHSLQLALETTVLKIANWLHEETGAENLVMAGGVSP
jgi:carbamoyltransferase